MKKWLISKGVLNVLEVALMLYIYYWRDPFWNAVSSKDFNSFIFYLGIFTVVACVLCVAQAASVYCGTRGAVAWREVLNGKAHVFKHSTVDNIAQRVQEDCFKYPDLMINLISGAGKALLFIISLSAVLLWNFHWSYLVIMLAYSVVATAIAKYIGNPQIELNYLTQKAEATYRQKLSKANFLNCIAVQIKLAKRVKYLQYFQSLYGQISSIVPLILLIPAYFGGSMTLGGLMFADSIMMSLTENTAYGVLSFDQYNKLLSCRRRLKEIEII